MRCGRIDGADDAPLTRFAEAAKAAGIDITVSKTINLDLWKKFVFLVALSGATASTRQPLGAIRADADMRALMIDLMREVIAVGRASGAAIADKFLDDQIKFMDAAPFDFKASMAHDLERGNRLELDWLAGKVREFGRALNIPTPASDTVYTVLKLHRLGTPR